MKALIQKFKEIKIKRILRALCLVIAVLTIIAFWTTTFFSSRMISSPDTSKEEGGAPFSAEGCNVAAINLHGELSTYLETTGSYEPLSASSEDILSSIRNAEEAENISAIVLDIDSLGGSPVAAEEIVNALKHASKPTVALIRKNGDSAAYWVATGANIIFASALSDVGSIGVTSSYLENARYNNSNGYDYASLSTGKYKDMGDPDKKLTEDEKAIIMRDIKKVYEVFIKTIAENRKLPIEKVRALADGSSMLGDSALQKGLIDRIGSYPEVKEYLKGKIGSEVSICW